MDDQEVLVDIKWGDTIALQQRERLWGITDYEFTSCQPRPGGSDMQGRLKVGPQAGKFGFTIETPRKAIGGGPFETAEAAEAAGRERARMEGITLAETVDLIDQHQGVVHIEH